MTTTVLVDAHNVFFRVSSRDDARRSGHAPSSGDAVRRTVIRLTQDALRVHGIAGATAHLVFDTAEAGAHRAGAFGREGAVSWSYAKGSADEAIVALVRERATEGTEGTGSIVVVSDDRELRGRVTQLGAKALRVGAWFRATPPPRPSSSSTTGPPMTPSDFGLTDRPIDLLRDDPDDL